MNVVDVPGRVCHHDVKYSISFVSNVLVRHLPCFACVAVRLFVLVVYVIFLCMSVLFYCCLASFSSE